MGDHKVHRTNDIHISPRDYLGATSGKSTMNYGDTLFESRLYFGQIFTQC